MIWSLLDLDWPCLPNLQLRVSFVMQIRRHSCHPIWTTFLLKAIPTAPVKLSWQKNYTYIRANKKQEFWPQTLSLQTLGSPADLETICVSKQWINVFVRQWGDSVRPKQIKRCIVTKLRPCLWPFRGS